MGKTPTGGNARHWTQSGRYYYILINVMHALAVNEF